MRSLIRALIVRFDRYMRRKMNIIEPWDHPDCLIRIRVGQSDHAVTVANGVIPAGSKIIEIHFWNEHVPQTASTGKDMKWAIRGVRMLMSSFNELARQVENSQQFEGVKALGGITPLFLAGDDSSGERIWKRLGFTLTQVKHPLGRFGEFFENIYTLLIIWAFNPDGVRNQRLSSMRRTEFWMSADDFLRIHLKGH